MWSTPFNPFTWDKTAQRVTSHVAGLEVKDGKGNLILMSDLSPGVTIILPLNKETPQRTFKKSAGKLGTTRHQNISVQHEKSAINILIVPQGNGLSVSRVKVIQPTEVATKERLLECIRAHVKWRRRGSITCKGRTQVAVTFVARHPGNYLLDIVFSGQKHSTKAAVEKNQDQELCIKIKESPSLTKSENVNYSVDVSESACLYWDKKEANWETKGCQVGE